MMERITCAGLVLVIVAGCSARVDLGGPSGPVDGGGIAPSSGSTTGSGGAPSESGGAPGAGGAMGSGGAASESGGAPGAGGAMGSGGADTAGSPGSGGTTGSGGSASSLCHDGLVDGDETDVDCGGSCFPCGFQQGCRMDADCSAVAAGCDQSLGGCACDAYAKICVASHCVDRWRDSSESDVDCGGECSPCGPGKICYSDSDCSATASGCDQCTCDANTSTCVFDHCYDHKLNFDETAVDCGGTKCVPCVDGKACLKDTDCASQACDAISRQCVANQCVDHQTDGNETDLDCGGPACPSCIVGMKCKTSLDCQSGHVCNGSKVCQ
jgi:hypothetical protein